MHAVALDVGLVRVELWACMSFEYRGWVNVLGIECTWVCGRNDYITVMRPYHMFTEWIIVRDSDHVYLLCIHVHFKNGLQLDIGETRYDYS